MKYLSFLFLFIIINLVAYSQSAPRTVTPVILATIKAEVEKEIPAYKIALARKKMRAQQIEFSTDTFRLQRVCKKYMDIDYSTAGMLTAMDHLYTGYDSLMNKYYKKLLQKLNKEDKNVLVTAQKAWLAFRDAEFKLIKTMTKDEYSGGGTVQGLISNGQAFSFLEDRTIVLYNYFIGSPPL